MRKGLIACSVVLGFTFLLVFVLAVIHADSEQIPELTALPIEEVEKIEALEKPVEVIDVKEIVYTDEELMAMVVHAESNNQPMVGKVAVASVILNRCDYYDLTVESVIYQKNQFAIANAYTEDDLRAVEIAKENRDLFPQDMLYFRADHYHSFGETYTQIGDHYFSTQGE